MSPKETLATLDSLLWLVQQTLGVAGNIATAGGQGEASIQICALTQAVIDARASVRARADIGGSDA